MHVEGREMRESPMGTKEDKTHNEVPERKQEQEKVPEQHGESQEDKSAGQDEELEREERSEFHAVPELATHSSAHPDSSQVQVPQNNTTAYWSLVQR